MEFSEELRRFQERTADPGFEGLILLGTERHNITAALLLGTLKLRRVAFLTTPETRTFPQFIAELLGRTPERWDLPEADHSVTLKVYRAVKLLREQWVEIEDPARIAVDVTGGLKPMSVGLEKAAHLLGLTTIYVQSNYGPLPDGRRGLLPGTQRLVVPPNPYIEFGDLQASEARRLFAAHDYTGAARLFDTQASRLQSAPVAADQLTAEDAQLAAEAAALAARYAASAKLAKAYAHWDSFDLPSAETALHDYLAAVPPESDRAALLTAQVADLATLTRVTGHAAGKGRDALATLADPDAVLPLLGSLYANALRRTAQGRYDSAALLCYRCLELCSQHRLAGWGILSEQPDLRAARARVPTLAQRYEAVQRRQFPGRRPYPLPDRSFGLFVGYMLLEALGDTLVTGYSITQIREGAQLRNQSIFAHGYRLITDVEYAQFAALVEQLLDRLFAVLARDRAAWAARSTFLPLE